MNNDFEKTNLHSKPLNFAVERLKDGKILSQLVLDRFELSDGSWWTFFGPDQRPTNLEKFECSTFEIGPEQAKQLSEYPNTVACLVEIVHKHLISRSDAVCVFEDAISDPGDGWLQSSDSRRMTCDGTILFFVTSSDDSREQIEKTILEAESAYPSLVGCMSSLPEDTRLPSSKGRISEGDLKLLVKRITHLVVGAFDGEAYLIWEPKVRPPMQ